jgi:lipoprotein-releasing system permease protein
MNFEYFVAKKLLKQKRKGLSKPIVSIATAGIALSIAVMLISIGVLQGFKNQIKDKITGFTSHIHLIPFAINSNNSTNTFTLSKQELNNLHKEENIKTIDPYILMGGAIKTKTDFHGVALKGVEANYDTTFFKENLKSGTLPDYKDEKNKERIAIVKLKSRTKAHKAHPDTDYQLLKDMVTGLKNQEEIKKWILKKQAETYIYITPEHRNCTFQFPNWVK